MGSEGLIAHGLTDNNFAPAIKPVDNRSVVLELSPALALDKRLRKAITP